ncbi:MAG: cupin domain-containing protein [Acidimicrobiia bacterium]|nr:cupin domain-containing protein [Acidimicrobiia bacterium]
MDADDVIEELGLEPHPEGGWFAEVWTHPDADGSGRPRGSSIYCLLREGERSHWHRVDVPEMWHHYAGDPLHLAVSADGEEVDHLVLGPDVTVGERPQLVVPAGHWQSAESMGDWTLAGCSLAPGFDWDGFELAPEDWSPDAVTH